MTRAEDGGELLRPPGLRHQQQPGQDVLLQGQKGHHRGECRFQVRFNEEELQGSRQDLQRILAKGPRDPCISLFPVPRSGVPRPRNDQGIRKRHFQRLLPHFRPHNRQRERASSHFQIHETKEQTVQDQTERIQPQSPTSPVELHEVFGEPQGGSR